MDRAEDMRISERRLSVSTRTENTKSDIARETQDFEPVRMLEVEISQPLPMVAAIDAQTGRTYRRGLALVRLHTQPLGLIDVQLEAKGLSASDYAAQIWDALGPDINQHLQRDGLQAEHKLEPTGLPGGDMPSCLRLRAQFLADPPFVSVIIPTHERAHQLRSSLRSVLALNYPWSRYEVVVVDSAPRTNATSELVEQIGLSSSDCPRVCYIREDRPGRGRACNRGLSIARGEIVAFTDDDVVVDAHWLAELARGFSVAEATACVSGLILPLELETIAQAWFLSRFRPEYTAPRAADPQFTQRLFGISDHRPNMPLYPYKLPEGAARGIIAYKRSVLRSVGHFDPALGAGTPTGGGEDLDLALRTMLKGYKLAYEPAAVAYHQYRREYSALRRQMYGYGVGYSACLAKTMLANPHLLPDLAGKLLRSARLALSSSFNPRTQADSGHKRRPYRKELTWLWRWGFLYGPIAYFRSRGQRGPHPHISHAGQS